MIVFQITSVVISILAILIAIRCVYIDYWIKKALPEYQELKETELKFTDTLKCYREIKNETKKLKKKNKRQ